MSSFHLPLLLYISLSFSLNHILTLNLSTKTSTTNSQIIEYDHLLINGDFSLPEQYGEWGFYKDNEIPGWKIKNTTTIELGNATLYSTNYNNSSLQIIELDGKESDEISQKFISNKERLCQLSLKYSGITFRKDSSGLQIIFNSQSILEVSPVNDDLVREFKINVLVLSSTNEIILKSLVSSNGYGLTVSEVDIRCPKDSEGCV